MLNGTTLPPKSISSFITLIPTKFNQYFKDIGSQTYQVTHREGKGFHVPALFSEFEIDGVAPSSEIELMDLFSGVVESGNSSGVFE